MTWPNGRKSAGSARDTGSLLALPQPPPSYGEWSAHPAALLINNPGVNAGHCGIFPSLWWLAGA